MSRGIVQLKGDDTLDIPGVTLSPRVPLAVEEARGEIEVQDSLDNTAPDVVSLVGILNAKWERNRRHKSKENIQRIMLDSLRARNGEYDPQKLLAIEEMGQHDVYMPLTNMKCQHAEAWVSDVMSSTERPWGIRPTSKPTPTEEVRKTTMEIVEEMVMEKADQGEDPPTENDIDRMANEEIRPIVEETLKLELNERARRMEDVIQDQLDAGGWESAFDDFTSDFVTLKCGIIKGPLFRRDIESEWVRDEYGTMQRVITEIIKPTFQRVSPFDAYPSPGAVTPDDGTFIERFTVTRGELNRLKGEAGYDSDAIDKVLEEFESAGTGFRDDFDSERADQEDKETSTSFVDVSERATGIDVWTETSGKDLKKEGQTRDFKGNLLEDTQFYQINAIVIGSHLIYVDFNTDPMGQRPYSKTTWASKPGSFWGLGVPELMRDTQRVCNATMRSLVYNMSIASGPQSEVDVDRLLPSEDLESVYPGKMWQTVNKGSLTTKAVNFFSPDSNAAELLSVYQSISQLADDFTGIPAFQFGNDNTVPGAGRTSSGLSMLMTSSAKGIRHAILNIDRDVIRTMIKRVFDWNMEFSEDETIKGDLDIVVSGAVQVMVNEQVGDRRMQFLNQTNNEQDLSIMGLEGRANVLREAAGALEMDRSNVVKEPQVIRQLELDGKRAAEQAQAQEAEMEQQLAQLTLQQAQMELQTSQSELQVAQVNMQVEMAKIELEREKIKLEGQKIAGDLQIKGRNSEAAAMTAAATVTQKGVETLATSAASQLDTALDAEEANSDTPKTKAGGLPSEGA